MALDSWLLDQHQHHGHPPTLRFYSWSPAALSLGVSQRHSYPEHWQRLTWRGQPLDLVQRPTGGRGVLHQGDLTYALVTTAPGPRHQVYEQLCQFLIQGWTQLGLPLQLGAPNRDYRRSAHCFGQATAADLVTPQGHKLIGSAQLRQGPAVLQHGSMQLAPDPDLWAQVFASPAPPPLALPPPATIMAALEQAAARCWGCAWVRQPLSDQEWQQVIQRQAADPAKVLKTRA
jgi:lipoate-protein ligase A